MKKISPSQLHSLKLCPCYEGKQTDSPAALEGTLMHERMVDGTDLEMNEEQSLQLEKCRQYQKPFLERADQVFRELPLIIYVEEGGYAMRGTADLVVITDKHGDVQDTKMGWQAVPSADENLQLKAYATAVFDKFPELETVTIHIISPRRDETNKAFFTREGDLEALRDEVAAVVYAALDPDAKPNPNNLCQYCAALPGCPAHVEPALEVAKQQGLTVPPDADPKTMTPEVIDQYGYELAHFMAKWAAGVKAKASEYAESGHEFTNLQTKQRRKAQAFTNNAEAMLALAEVLPLNVITKGMTLSIPKLREAVMEAVGSDGENPLIDEFEKVVADHKADDVKISYLTMVSGKNRRKK